MGANQEDIDILKVSTDPFDRARALLMELHYEFYLFSMKGESKKRKGLATNLAFSLQHTIELLKDPQVNDELKFGSVKITIALLNSSQQKEFGDGPPKQGKWSRFKKGVKSVFTEQVSLAKVFQDCNKQIAKLEEIDQRFSPAAHEHKREK